MVGDNGEWRWNLFDTLLYVHVLLQIVAVKPPIRSTFMDRLGWKGKEDRSFSVKSSYHMRVGCDSGDKNPSWGLISKLQRPQRIKTFLWLFVCGRILTNSERLRQHLALDDSFGICGILWYLIRGWGHESTLATSRQLVTNFCLAKSKSSVVSSSTRKNARVDARWRAPGRGGVS
ncbi:hypothetical protein V6N12_030853 [Hibiscus sabdariffa]|uniref:Reverse transcriptase zinc-binding domain-containing protein n=1 Tax=Hibiscus sabdariffa TaxID=183260 RepID=A0ABR2E761_9ROSI